MFTQADIERAFLNGARWAVKYEAERGALPPRDRAAHAAETYAMMQANAAPAPAPAPAPEPKKRSSRKKKEERPAGWAPAAWEQYQAVLAAKTYAQLDVTKLRTKVAAALDRKEEIRPPVKFSALLYAGKHPAQFGGKQEDAPRDAVSAAVEWGKLGVSGADVRFETAEEYARLELVWEANEAAISASVYDPTGKPDPYLNNIYAARSTAQRLLDAGMREAARELLRTVRRSERTLLEHFGSLRPFYPAPAYGVQPTRENHRAERRKEREKKLKDAA